jgi:dUTP pyrophosphatase
MILKWTPTRPKEWHHAPTKETADAGWDFYAARTTIIQPMQFAQIPTNISIALPSRHWGLLLGRSSTFFKRQLMVHQGTIDSGYRGEIMGLVFNPTQHKVTIRPEDRVFQLIVISMPNQQTIKAVKSLPSSKRGVKGFGSTGT